MQNSKNNVSIFKVASYLVMSIALATIFVNITNIALARTITKTNIDNQNISTTNTIKKVKDNYLTGISPRTEDTQWSRGGGFISADNVNSSYFRITDYGELIIGPSTNGSDRIYAEGNGYFTGNLMVGQGSTIDGYNLKDYGQYWIDTPGTAGQVWTSDGYRAGHWATPSSSGSVSGVTGAGTGGFISRWQSWANDTSVIENSSIYDSTALNNSVYVNTYSGIVEPAPYGGGENTTIGIGVPNTTTLFDWGIDSIGKDIGVIGKAKNTYSGIGVLGTGFYGVKGIANSSGGYGIYGEQGTGSYAGYFSGNVKSTGKTQTSKLSVTTSNTPSSSSSSCNRGDITWDGNYIYVCVSSNNWKRSSLSSWTNSADDNIDNL